MRTVLSENSRPHISNKSSRLGPRSSMTKALYFPHGPKKNTSGMPSEKKAGALETNKKIYNKLIIINRHTH